MRLERKVVRLSLLAIYNSNLYTLYSSELQCSLAHLLRLPTLGAITKGVANSLYANIELRSNLLACIRRNLDSLSANFFNAHISKSLVFRFLFVTLHTNRFVFKVFSTDWVLTTMQI